MQTTIEPVSLLREVAATASQIDAGSVTPRAHLSALGAEGLLDTQLPVSAALISDLAGECMSTAFSLWAHRMVLEYFRLAQRSVVSENAYAKLRSGEAIGSTAMASGLKWLAGIGEVALTATEHSGSWQLDGFIPWASNLYEDAIVVLPARGPDGVFVAWVHASELEVRPVTGLLALNGTASGNLVADGVQITPDQVLSPDLAALAAQFRPVFLLLQTAFCVGLVHRCLTESEAALDRAENAVFAAELSQLTAEATQHRIRWAHLVDQLDGTTADYLRLRLEAANLAARATRLETTLAGGRGYQATSAASRRFREAAFLPVQSPSEGHLRWELSLLD